MGPMRPAAAAALGCAALALAGAAEMGTPGGSARLLASEGALFFWDGASTDLRPAPPGLASTPRGFRAVLPLEDGRAVLIEPAEQPPGKQKEKKVREGEAVVLGVRESGAERGQSVPFEGAPSAAAVSPDGRRAYVLAWRGDPGAQGSRGWLHAIDLERAEMFDSSLLSSPAFGLATDRTGVRLYVGLKDRIQTYGADPVRVSWQYRSPGQNGPIAAAPGADVLAVGRGAEVALFDAARLAAAAAEERHSRKDDATTVATLPFVVNRLAWSDDGALLAAIGLHGLVFIDPGNGALLWPSSPTIDLSGATDAFILKFPGSDHDLVVAAVPTGTVSALRAPVPSAPVAAAPPPLTEAPAPIAVAAERPPQPADPTPKPAEPVPSPASPATEALPSSEANPGTPTDIPGPAEPAPGLADTAAVAPGPDQNDGPPRLSGRVKGSGARAIVLYGPNNILKEATRVSVQQDGTWSLDLPAPGTYRLVPIGDGSTPIPVVPSFRTVTVRAGIGEMGLDFEVRPGA